MAAEDFVSLPIGASPEQHKSNGKKSTEAEPAPLPGFYDARPDDVKVEVQVHRPGAPGFPTTAPKPGTGKRGTAS